MPRVSTHSAPGARDKERDAANKLKRDIERLASSIQKFRVNAQRFFAGDLPLPPDELRERIQDELRRLRRSNLRGAAANFRLGSLEAQFSSHLDLFGRRLRAREEGERNRRAAAAKAAALDPVQGVVVGPKVDPKAAAALYQGLFAASASKPKMDLQRFGSYLHGQAEAIRTKTGCREIQFRIAVEDGKMKLKAKPVRPSS